MKIVLVNNYWYLRGGSERVLFATKKLLEEAGHAVEIFGMQHPDNDFSNKYFCSTVEFDASGFGKIRSGFKAIFNFEAKRKFEELVTDFKPDVIHFHNIYHHLSFSLIGVAQKYHVPTLMTVHDYHLLSPNYNLFHHGEIDETTLGRSYYRCFFTNSLGNWKKSLIATLEMYVRKLKKLDTKIDHFISPSEFLKQKHMECGFDGSVISVVRNPLDEISNMELHDGEGVLYFGRLSEEKGLDILLDVVKQTPQLVYTLVGDGSMKRKLEDRVRTEQITNVRLVGKKTGQDLWNIIKESRVVVAPSCWYENAPMGIAEAMQYGKVVIARDIGGIPELLPQEMLSKTGDADDFAKHILTWYDCSAEKRIEAGKKLQQKIKKISDPKTYLKNVLTIYESLSNVQK